MGMKRVVVTVNTEDTDIVPTVKWMVQEYLPFVGWSDAAEEGTSGVDEVAADVEAIADSLDA